MNKELLFSSARAIGVTLLKQNQASADNAPTTKKGLALQVGAMLLNNFMGQAPASQSSSRGKNKMW